MAIVSDKNPETLLRRIADGKPVEPENYLDMVMTEWLPRQHQNEKYASALNALAQRFEQRHGERWLRDALAAPPSQRGTDGLAALAQAVQANLADETDR